MAKNTKSDSKEETKKSKKAPSKAKPEGAEASAKAPEADGAERPRKPKNTASVKRNPIMPRTYFAEPGRHNGWRIVDATGIPLGRLSSHIALLLMGKDKVAFTRHEDAGDHVVVINASNVKLTGNKWSDKTYHYHTNYPGGIKSFTARELLEKNPERLVQWAVWGMLPKSKKHMARKWYKKLRVFPGAEHPHMAQTPVPVKLPNIGTWEKA